MQKRLETTENNELQSIEDTRWTETLPALKSVRERKSVPGEKVFAWMESWGTEEELPKPE